MFDTKDPIPPEELEIAVKGAIDKVQRTLRGSYNGEWMDGVTRTLVTYAVKSGEADPAASLQFDTPLMKRLTEEVTSYLRCDYHGPANFYFLRRTLYLGRLVN